jgi:hypothetical protein
MADYFTDETTAPGSQYPGSAAVQTTDCEPAENHKLEEDILTNIQKNLLYAKGS